MRGIDKCLISLMRVENIGEKASITIHVFWTQKTDGQFWAVANFDKLKHLHSQASQSGRRCPCWLPRPLLYPRSCCIGCGMIRLCGCNCLLRSHPSPPDAIQFDELFQFTDKCKSSNWRSLFPISKFMHRLQSLSVRILNWHRWSQIVIYDVNPVHMSNGYSSFTKCSVAPRRSYCCGKISTTNCAEQYISPFLGKFVPLCDGNRN
jgi:hypothetical protein